MKKKVAGRRRAKRAPSRGGGGYGGAPPPPFPAHATGNNPHGDPPGGMGGMFPPGPPGGGPMAPRRSASPTFANQGRRAPLDGGGGRDYPPHPSHAGAPNTEMGSMGHHPYGGGGYGGTPQLEAPLAPRSAPPPPPCCCKPMLRRDYGYKCRNANCGIKRSRKWAEQVRAGTQRIPPTCPTCNHTLKKLSAKAPYKCPNRHFHFLVEKNNNN